MFKVGQKVVCIAHIQKSAYNESIPKKDESYTIRSITERSGLRLVEITNKSNLYKIGYTEPSFAKNCFQPLQEQTNFAEESLKEVRIQQLEHRLERLEELVNHPEKSI